MVNFPTPIGGNITDDDIVPSAIFLALHAFLLPVIAWNYLKRHQWNAATFGSTLFAVERVLLYLLRLRHANSGSSLPSNGLLAYQQASLGYGFTVLIVDYFNMFRCLVVETTLPDNEAGHPDLVGRRFWFRRFTDGFALSFLPINAVGMLATSSYRIAIQDQFDADQLWHTRFITIIIDLQLHHIAIAAVTYGLIKLPRIRQRACVYILSVLFLLEIHFIYRIRTLRYTETSLTATGPGTITSKGAKAVFYLLQSAIELCVLAFLLVSPMRRLYGVGKWRDHSGDHKQQKRDEEERLTSAAQLTPAKQNWVQLS